MASVKSQTKIAIVGVAAQLPAGGGKDDLDYAAFWDFLAAKGQARQRLSPEIFSSSEFGALASKTMASLPAEGAFLKNYDGLDAVAFGISAKDARVMPFTGRRLVELSFAALADSGIDYRNKKVGCFMSGTSNFEISGAMSSQGSLSWIPSALANRVSYMLDITGPSVQLDTACSSSLTGLHMAILAIEKGDCSAAVVGAAQINRELSEWKNYVLSAVLSPDGVTKPFDAGADGFGRGEGAVAVVIKTLEDALRDNDHIYSVILGSAINSTGSRMPLNVPNAVAQKECIQTAYARAGREVTDADFVELHITGTSIGDPIEANAAGEIFARPEPLDVGTIKGNVGHLEATAFLVSLLKACHILEKKVIPPTVNLSVPSPAIEWDKHQLRVPTELVPLECRSDSGRSIISLASAGIGGSTGHVVIESPPTRDIPDVELTGGSTVTFIVGGLSPKAVASIAQCIREADLSSMPIMRACAVTLARRARQLPWRTYFTLPVAIPTEIPPAILVPPSSPPIAFIFSGQGPQNLAMGRGLFAAFPVFRSTILELDDVYRREIGESLLETTGLFVSEDALTSPPSLALSPTGWPVTITVAAIAMLQMALFDLLVSVGITPGSLVGHSAGETALLYASGAGPKAMALEIAIARGQAMTPTQSAQLGMASLACSAEVAKKIVAQVPGAHDTVEISCFNSPNSVALSGSAALLGEAISLARAQGIFAQRIRTMVPGHSFYMDAIKDDYLARMNEIFARYPGAHVPTIPVFSTCTGKVLVDKFSPAYFWSNCRNPVLFSPAISNVLDFHAPVFLEISCHPVLSSLIYPHGVPETSVLCPMRRASAPSPAEAFAEEQTLFAETLARLVLLGYNSCDLSGLYGASEYKPPFIDHPFVSRSIPPPKTHFSELQRANGVNGPLAATVALNELTQPLLAQHVINGEPILPATGFIEILLEAGANVLWDVEFMTFYSLSARNSARMVLEREGCKWALKSVEPGVSMAMGKEHARGLMDSIPVQSPDSVEVQSIWDRLPTLEMEGFYQSLQPFATFGPAFRNVLRCHGGPSEVIAEIQGPQDESPDQFRLNPAILDACLHIMLHPAVSKQTGPEAMYLPAKLGRFVQHNPAPASGNWFSHIRRRAWAPDSKSYDVVVRDASGAAICEFTDLVVQRLSVPRAAIRRRFDRVFQPVAVPVASASSAAYSQRERQSDEEALFSILDALAVEMIAKSLQTDVTVGEDVSRQRYFEFAQRAVKKGRVKTFFDDGEMFSKYPAHFEVTSRIAEVHETVFNSSKRAVDALYSDDLMTRFYSRSSQTSTVYPEAAKSFSSLLDSLQSGGKHAINILEVGAGTGLLTKYLIEELQRKPDLLAEYTVTDASYALAAELARTIQYNKVTPKLYDLTQDASSQGIVPESYDVIVALHVLHAVPDIRSCLSALRDLLVPGGSLFVIEIDGTSWGDKVGSIWFDCVFGSFNEWFGFQDGRTHCTMSPSAWMDTLHDLGFVNNHASAEPGDGGHNFFFTAQKPGFFALPADTSKIDSRGVVQYSFGNEMDLQLRLSELNPKDPIEIYLVALQGRDGDSAMGLIATLSLEHPFWDIRLAIFESAPHLPDAIKFISVHRALYKNGEQVVLFRRDGSPCCSRVILSPAPVPIAADYPVALDDPEHVIIEIIALGPTAGSVHGFVGRVVRTGRTALSQGDLVAGITDQPKASLLVVHIGCLVSLDAARFHDHPDPAELIKVAVPILIQDCLPKRPPHSRTQVLVATEDESMANMIAKSLEVTETVGLVQCDFQDPAASKRVDVVISDSLTNTQYPHLRQWVPRSGRFLLWDTIVRDNIRDGTWEIAHALKLGLSQLPGTNGSQPLANGDSSDHRTHSQLFRQDKSYILLGGIGGLGVDLAVWMYQHGAKHIILTSRKGIESLDPQTDAEALAKIAYLRGCDDLILRLEKCDATDALATSLLVRSLAVPIAGCFQMTLVLSDALFLKQTQTSFTAVHDSKIKVFEIFSAEVDINFLDFYIAFSSLTGLIGIPGQSNYASACTVLEGALASYRNAFSIVVPAILDVGYLDRAGARRSDKTDDGVFATSMSAAGLWACIQDGLQKILDGQPPFTRYIPDLDWGALNARYPLPSAFHYLLSSEQPTIQIDAIGSKGEEDILQIVLSFVEVAEEDFDTARPLLSYGLDSLSATRLASALQPYLHVSQVQLLAGVSWAELSASLQTRSGDPGITGVGDLRAAREILLVVLGMDETEFDDNVPIVSYGLDSLSASKLATALRPHLPVTQLQLLARTTWADLAASVNISAADHGNPLVVEENVVEICWGSGIPLWVFAGGDGRLAPLLGLRPHFSGPLWGIQITESTPTAPFAALVAFLAEKIRQKQPDGPYRLAAFSASSVISIAVARYLEGNGQEILQLTFIDGFPMLWTLESTELSLRKQDLPTMVDGGIAQMIDLLRRDPLYGPDSKQAAQWELALLGSNHAEATAVEAVEATKRLASSLVQFLTDFYSTSSPQKSYTDFADPFTHWVSTVKAPFSLLIAEHGLVETLPSDSRSLWADLGAHRYPKPVQRHVITNVGHFGILADKRTAAFLQQHEHVPN
ncbi:hypothetical protein DFH07DRAFT_798454 [Mycena maculata]|uniref:Polyketide synthase n=1 Tax=Mycena maculata TaxID=230809 RepID=A0AAD7K3S6_9AGAR|nr:hypothetical protein DFH07DRAFT_798454 [Mycena maculata]